jgi:hypothetical protein
MATVRPQDQAAGVHLSLWRGDLLLAKRPRHQSDLAAVLNVDQPMLMHDAPVPKRIRGQKVRGREERAVLADDAEAVRSSVAGDLQARAVAIRRACDRYQAAGSPDFLRIMLQAEHVEEQDLDSDVDVRVDRQAIAIRPERDAVLADRRPLPQGAEAQVPWCRGVSADGGERPQQRHRSRRRGQTKHPSAAHVGERSHRRRK